MVSNPAKIRLYSAWFCPYAQRAWMVLNNLGITYNLIESLEVDKSTQVYKKSSRLLEINEKGLVPTLEVFESEPSDLNQIVDVNQKQPLVITESIDVMKYLYEHDGKTVHDIEVTDANIINKAVCSPFYRCLMKQTKVEQLESWNDLLSGLEQFCTHVRDDNFFKSDSPSIVDFTLYPWAFRLYVLEKFRGLKLDLNLPWVEKFTDWQKRMEDEVKGVLETLPNKDQLLNSYERYEDASAKSLVGDAVRAGKEAHDI
jgi:glutathione S-transferase